MTGFADSALTVPIAAALFALLVLLRETRNALLWAAAMGLVLAGTVVLKLSFAGCAPPSPLALIRSPSGHTATATIVYGGLGAILGGGVLLTLAQSLAVAALIGASRVLLAAHSVPEACVGGLLGLLGATCLACLWRPVEQPRRRRTLAILAPLLVVGLAGLLHGRQWSSEPFIHRTSVRFWALHVCAARPSRQASQESEEQPGA